MRVYKVKETGTVITAFKSREQYHLLIDYPTTMICGTRSGQPAYEKATGTALKSFDTKQQANAYFRKAVEGHATLWIEPTQYDAHRVREILEGMERRAKLLKENKEMIQEFKQSMKELAAEAREEQARREAEIQAMHF